MSGSLRSTALVGCVAIIGGAWAWGALASDPPAATQTATTVPARDARRKNPIPADDGSRASGKGIYTGNCAPCHGATGNGKGAVAYLQELPPKDLTDSKFNQDSDGTLYWKISNGHRPMPKFENLLPDESRWNVVNYLRTLISKPATTSAPATAPAGNDAPVHAP